MFYDESWKPICFGDKKPTVKVKSKNIAGVGLYTLVSAGFFWLLLLYTEFTCKNGNKIKITNMLSKVYEFMILA